MKKQKLELSKKTVSVLDKNDMDNLKGGSSHVCTGIIIGTNIIRATVDFSVYACEVSYDGACQTSTDACLDDWMNR